MFRKLKQWFQHERCETNTLEIFQDDPRELPRPDRYKITAPNKNKFTKEKHTETKPAECNCKNCCEISDNFAECMVCMDPLQCAAISSCMFCGNYTCWNCSQKVTHCPFCRASFLIKENRVRNFALERILLKLELPCKHARWGCKINVNHKERTLHEASCMFAPIGCPLVKLCGWNGGPVNIIKHLKDTHDMTLIAATNINVEIADFRVKLLNTSMSRLYMVSLACHGNIYICKLKMLNQKLRFIFFQITGETSPQKDKKFGAWLEITSGTGCLKGTVEISPKYRNNKEIIIPGEALLLTKNETDDDLVKISITIKPF